MEFQRGSIWRKWDLHIHTPGTAKNDQFRGESLETKWQQYLEDINQNDEKIKVLGVTDYFSVENYFVLKKHFLAGKITGGIELLIPNVELRITPVTGSSTPINIHCIFNPDIDEELESRFLSKLKFKYGHSDYSAKRDELIRLGKAYTGNSSLDAQAAYNIGINQYVIGFEQLRDIFSADQELRKNTVIIVANGTNDGVSGIRKHADFFIGKNLSQLDATRQSIYQFSDALFSSNKGDYNYFLGLGPDSAEEVIRKCRSLKPCFHGCDAHSNEAIFKPNEDKFCWIKADLTFGGLKQAIHEASRRVYIGENPPTMERVKKNRSKFIHHLKIDWAEGYQGHKGKWFRSVDIPLNPELVAIIGNKGSGKSALADIIALSGNSYQERDRYSFLREKKFGASLSRYFQATIEWFSKDIARVSSLDRDFVPEKAESVKYLPQSHFEDICNEIDSSDKFRKEIEKVVFQHVLEVDRAGYVSFTELVRAKEGAAKAEIDKLKHELSAIIDDLIVLDEKSHSSFRNKIESSIDEKRTALKAHVENPPQEVPKPKNDEENNPIAQQLSERREQLSAVEEKIESLEEELTRLNRLVIEIDEQVETFESLERQVKRTKEDSKALLHEWGIDVEDVFTVQYKEKKIVDFKKQKTERVQALRAQLKNSGFELLENGKIIHEGDELDSEGFLLIATPADHREYYLRSIAALEKQLSETQRKYEDYLQKRRNWEKRRQEIQGKEDGSEPDTLKYFETVLKYLDNELPGEIETKRHQLTKVSLRILEEKNRIKNIYDSIKKSIECVLESEYRLLANYPINIESSLHVQPDLSVQLLSHVNKGRAGTFYRMEDGGEAFNSLLKERNLGTPDDLTDFINDVLARLDFDYRPKAPEKNNIFDQVSDLSSFYKSLYYLDYLEPNYDLKHGSKSLDALSPGERGALLLVFYLMLDQSDTPLIIDQPEDNLDNQSVAEILVPFIQQAKERRQIIMVTHNPNLAVVADAEQIIRVDVKKNEDNQFEYKSGSIENPEINKEIVDVLEGRMPAFSNRSLKYLRD